MELIVIESFFLGSKGKRSKERSKADACLRELPQWTPEQAWISGYLPSLLLSTQREENKHCTITYKISQFYKKLKTFRYIFSLKASEKERNLQFSVVNQ